MCSSHFLPQCRCISHSLGLLVSPLVDYIFQMQVIGGHWFVAAFRMIMTSLEEERVGSEFGLYSVYVVLQGRLDRMKSVGFLSYCMYFIFEVVCIWGTAPA